MAVPMVIPTIRGAILLLLHGYFLVGPVWTENDLVAASLVTCFFVIAISFFLFTFFVALRARQIEHVSIFPAYEGTENSDLIAKEPAKFDLVLPVKLLPFTKANVVIEFNQPDAPHIECTFGFASDAIARINAIFPHRGMWSIHSYKIQITDILGMWNANFIKKIDQPGVFEVLPEAFQHDYPVVQSTEREGDTFPNQANPTGDLYEIKRYNPNDGLRKIVWKVFARTNELLSRHPEPTMTPEGKTVIFVAAGKNHDKAYSAAYEYAKLREQEGFEVIISSATITKDNICNSSEEFMEQAIGSAWNEASTENLEGLISYVENQSLVKTIPIFVDFTNDVDQSLQIINQCIRLLQQKNLSPTLMVVGNDLLWKQMHNPTRPSKFSSVLKALLKDTDPVSDRSIQAKNVLNFIRECELNQWQVAGVNS